MATSKRDPSSERGVTALAARLADPGYTPSVRQVGDLLDAFAAEDEDLVKRAERAVLRIETQYAARVATELVSRARTATRPARGRLTHLAGRLAHEKRDPEGTALAWLLESLADPDPKTHRAAARGLGKLPPTQAITSALTKAFDEASSEDDKKVFALALGKTGSEDAAARLAGGDHARAALIASREVARKTKTSIATTRVPAAPARIWFHTRSGLEDVVKDELGTMFGKARFVAPGAVEAELTGALETALAVRTALHVGFPLPPIPRTDDLAADITRALGQPDALAIFKTFTTSDAEQAPIRFRLAFTRGGHQRGVVWRTAELVRAASPLLINDPTESTWEVVVDDVAGQLKLELVPRAWVDTRFEYRQATVAASSHPTIAAALARIAPRSSEDVVWDPFAGAGAELVERARLGQYARLVGTDLDARAVDAAKANVKRAGLERVTLEANDSTTFRPEGVNVILTNPPMGRRVHRGTHADLLERFVAHAAEVLTPGGALVWLVPEPQVIRKRAEASGLVHERAFAVDMGGFSAELTVYVKRAAPKARRIVGKSETPPKRPRRA